MKNLKSQNMPITKQILPSARTRRQ